MACSFKLVVACIAINLLYLQYAFCETIIYGKVSGNVPEKIGYSLPINGVVFGGFKEYIKTDDEGKFQIKLNPQKTSFLLIMIPDGLANKIIIEPNQAYHIHISLDKDVNYFKVFGKYSEGQNLYTSLPNPSFLQSEVGDLINETSIDSIQQKILKLKSKDLLSFKMLLDKEEISKSFFDAVVADRDCYYATMAVTIPLLKLYKTKPDRLGEFPSEMKSLLRTTFNSYPATKKDFIGSSFWFEYAKNFIFYNEFNKEDFSILKLKEFYDQGTIHTHNIQESKKHLSGEILEYYQAAYLYSEGLQPKKEKELISLFEEFKQEWPKSDFTKYLEPIIKSVVDYHKIIEERKDESINFVKDYEKFNSLKECIAPFKGKKIYIDIWATWCGPCLEEFKYNSQLTELLKSKGFEILYISIDGLSKEDKWQEFIRFYNLKGNHLRANQNLVSNLTTLYNNNGVMSIPWYMIIDENGNIIKLNAPRPSEYNLLESSLMED